MSSYSEPEWETMLFAPLWVFAAIANADGKIDDNELVAFRAEVEDAREFENELTRDVLKDLAANFDEVLEVFKEDETSIEDGLSEVAGLLEEYEDEDIAFGFKADLIAIAAQVAKASGGWLFGSAISDEEQAVFKHLATALGISRRELGEILEEVEAG